MRNRVIYISAVCGLSVVLAACDTQQNNQRASATLSARAIDDEPGGFPFADTTLAVYSDKFADRMGLDREGVVDLPEGLLALEFTFEKRRDINHCMLKTYTENNLDIEFPSNDRVGSYWIHGNHFFMRNRENMILNDVIKIEKSVSSYIRHAFLISEKMLPDHPRYEIGLFYWEYFKGFIDDVDYSKFSIGCLFGRYMGPYSDSIELWFKRNGGADYTRVESVIKDDFIKFKLPTDFVERVIELMRASHEYYGR